MAFSLNKKKRWELSEELTKGMSKFANDDIDVRLYETRNRNEKKSNCIAVHKSKGDKIEVKKTFANLESIKKAQDLEAIAKNTKSDNTPDIPKVRISKKNRKCSKPPLNLSERTREVIVIDDNSEEEEDNSYVQYEIEYAPKSDILKYDVRKYTKDQQNFDKASTNRTAKNLDLSNLEDLEYSDFDLVDDDIIDSIEEKDSQVPDGPVFVDLDELIDLHLVKIIEKNSLKEFKALKPVITNEIITSTDKKDRKIYVEKDDEESLKFGENEKKKNNNSVNRKTATPIPLILSVQNAGLDSHSLKSAYGLKYAEAHLSWPRNFSINLDEEIRERLLKKASTNKDYDIVVWLRFQQTSKNDPDITEFKVSILSNLNCESIALENVNPCAVFNMSSLVEKAIEFVISLPVDLFRFKDFSKPWSQVQSSSGRNQNNLIDELPNIGGEKQVKTLDQIKLELVNDSLSKFRTQSSPQRSTTPPPPTVSTVPPAPPAVVRSNSIEVVKDDDVVNVDEERKVKDKLDTIFELNTYECILCFDQKTTIEDCVVIKTCAHCICQACMHAYIDSHLFNTHLNAGTLQCPGCETDLELALMINYASDANLMEIFIRQTIERVVFVLNEYKWCPSPYCGKILQVDLNSNPYGTVSCTCGFKMCLRCNNAPHFPAKCSQITNYYKELKVNNDFYNPEDSQCMSFGKRCPICHTFIEKNGGCNHMYCITCKKYFCWNCLVEWEEHCRAGGQCKGGVKFGEVQIEFKKDRKALKPKANQIRYEDSLNHRKKRTFQDRRQLMRDARRLVDTINFNSLTNVYGNSSSQTEINNKFPALLDETMAKRDEVKKYLASVINFLNELHFVCEHSYVLISDNSLPRNIINRIRNVINSIEVNIWLIEAALKNGHGMGAVDELRKRHDKSLMCIKMLKGIRTDE